MAVGGLEAPLLGRGEHGGQQEVLGGSCATSPTMATTIAQPHYPCLWAVGKKVGVRPSVSLPLPQDHYLSWAELSRGRGNGVSSRWLDQGTVRALTCQGSQQKSICLSCK